MITTPSHDINLLKLLIEITQSLKTVNVKDRFDFDEILYEYKNAIFEVKSEGTEVKSEEAFRKFAHSLALGEKLDENRLDLFLNSNKYLVEKGDWVKIIAKWKKENVANIVSSDLKSETLLQFYKDHACCWVNYIGCDSFSDKVKRQVFFSSVLMEDEDEILNKKLLTINDRIFKTYNNMLDERIPADLWVQLFFLDPAKINEMCEGQRIAATKQTQLLNTFSDIQNYGLEIPLGYDSSIDSDNSRIRPLLINKQRIEPVTIDNVNQLLIDRKRAIFPKEVIKILDSISSGKEISSYLSEQIGRLNKSLHHDVNYLYYLPAEGANGAVGLIIYGADRRLSNEELDDIKLLGYNVLFPYVSAYKSAWENQMVVRESIKSAISAIMSRNMSHNLGSHCMHYTKTALENLSGRLYGHGPEVRGAARLISYIQGRMDFLATLVSGEEYPYGAVNFKSQILDVLTIDEFSKRHYKASTVRDKYKVIKQSQLSKQLESVLSQLDDVIRNKKERDNKELSRVVASTEGLISQLECLKLDNADLRTTNFLLENLIKSERFYRESVYDNAILSPNIQEKPFYLYVRYNGVLFTGSEQRIVQEDVVKTELSQLHLAMPGGLMSTHAFYNIVENLIRNSAKHRSTDLTESALITTIDIRDEIVKGNHTLRFTIYDNKHNANIVYPIIVDQLKELRILNVSDTTINKKSKGLKEMLIAALWLRANEQKEDYSVLLNRIELEKDEDKKLALIRDYAYEMVQVDDLGNDSNESNANLGLRFYLPCFETCTSFKVVRRLGETITQSIVNSLKEKQGQVRADIVAMDESEETITEASKRFPRLFDNRTIVPLEDISIIESDVIEDKTFDEASYRETIMLYAILKKRFGGDLNQYQVVFGDSSKSVSSPENIVYFQRHFNKSQDFSDAESFLYADSVSGGNFTVTLQDNYLRGHSFDGKCLTWRDKYFSYKILESALTRITLIDERLSDDYNDQELKSKNLRVLNLNPETPDEEKIWSGSSFKGNDDYTLFLSIHLGLIEKVINNDGNWFMRQYNFECPESMDNRPERASYFMELLKRKFGKGREIFISVHSGRGNYSYELEHSLKEYPFINLSAIESVFSNSKYLLTQLFYNTIFIGKGEYNQK